MLGETAAAFNRLIDALARSREVEEALASFSSALAGHLDVKQLTAQALERLLEHTGTEAGPWP
jgi:pentatricopeptide repeat protein